MMQQLKPATLKRSISLPLLIFYGLGTMVGGGIYALTGKVVGEAGMYAPLSFIISAFLALLTALSYAELTSRYPHSAGEVKYVSAAFSKKNFSILIGWLIVFMGIVSAAALSDATVGFIQDLVNLPRFLVTILLIIFLGSIAIWGISQSVWLVVCITFIELGGLVFIIIMGWDELASVTTRWPEIIPSFNIHDFGVWVGILSGTYLAFYAFVGFEDIVNIAEEVKDARRTLPYAIIVCILTVLILYCLIITLAVLSVTPSELAQSNTPLARILESIDKGVSPSVMIIISLMATVNGALVQIIMGSRVLYGMAKQQKAPHMLSDVSARTRTPVKATLLMIFFILSFSLLFDLEILVRITSTIVLFVFACVNAALLKIKWSHVPTPKEAFNVHWSFVLVGLVACIGMLSFEIWRMSMMVIYQLPTILDEFFNKSSGFILSYYIE